MKILAFLILMLLPLGTFFLALPANSESVTVENNFSSTVNTGGNSANNGEVKEGKSWVDIVIKTMVNGEILEDTKISREATDEPIIINRKIEKSSNNAKSMTEIKVEMNAESSTDQINQIINSNDENNDDKEESAKISARIEEFFDRLFERIKEIFKD